MHFEFDTQRKAINLIAKNSCLEVINWPNHLRVIKIYKGVESIEVPGCFQVKEKTLLHQLYLQPWSIKHSTVPTLNIFWTRTLEKVHLSATKLILCVNVPQTYVPLTRDINREISVRYIDKRLEYLTRKKGPVRSLIK